MFESDAQTRVSRFRIVREDLQIDPTELIAEGVKIGRLPSCELVLNHPSVSRLHAGINETDGRFYFYNFSASSGTTLNGRVVPNETPEVLADGDMLQIGPFFLHVGRGPEALSLRVTLEVAGHIGETEARLAHAPERTEDARAAKGAGGESEGLSHALGVFWAKRKRHGGSMQGSTALRPQKPQRVLGKARFNWTPTRDLVRPWPFSIFVWGSLAVALFSVVAAVVYAQAYSPAPVSEAHARGELRTSPAIALRPNSNSCTSCHTLTGSLEQNCAACHQAEGFKATVTRGHAEAGVGCASCHVEHQGTDARPSTASIQTCSACHNDANPKTYNGRRVGTPHGGTFGYPVAGGKWVWTGLSAEEWARKSPELRKVVESFEPSLKRAPGGGDPADVRRSAEFHALHMHRVKAAAGLASNRDGEVSCSTCHQSFTPIDRETPRTTCAECHNGDRGGKFQNVLTADRPNCISCHVQHPQGRREWGRQMLQ
jgi:hypothetical protein